MRYFLFAAICCLIFSCKNEHLKELEKATSIIENVKSNFVPDKRLMLFDVSPEIKQGQLVLKGETISAEAYQSLLQQFEGFNLPVLDSVSLLPSEELSDKIFGIVNLSVCNIRSQPKHSAELATQALLGTPLRIFKKEGDFYYIQTPDNYLGWVDDGGLTLMEENEYLAWQLSDRAMITEDFAYAYEQANEHSPKVTDLVAGNIVQQVGVVDGFMEIQMPDKRTGFVKTKNLVSYFDWLENSVATQSNILGTAKEFMGRPYLWGGTSGKGMDCSGFTKTVYYLNGVQLERDASLQVHTGELVETDTAWKNLQPGDLLFFGRKATEGVKERVSHVAIYMGDGKIIHASDMVKVESLFRGEPGFAESRISTFIRAKRIMGSEGRNGIVSLKESPFYKPVDIKDAQGI